MPALYDRNVGTKLDSFSFLMYLLFALLISLLILLYQRGTIGQKELPR